MPWQEDAKFVIKELFQELNTPTTRQSKRTWAPNIKRVKALVNGTPKTVHVCTRCLRSERLKIIELLKMQLISIAFLF